MKIQRIKLLRASFMTDGNADAIIIKDYKDELKSIDGTIAYCKEQIEQAKKEHDVSAIKEYKTVMADRMKRKGEILKILKQIGEMG